MRLVTATGPLDSPARVGTGDRKTLRIGVVQHQWLADQAALQAQLDEGIALAVDNGAGVVFLAELTLSKYPADTLPSGPANELAEDLATGPTMRFATAAAARHGVLVHASLFERADIPEGVAPARPDGLGYNTAILVDTQGTLVARTRKVHIPKTAGYYEDKYFRGGPGDNAFPVVEVAALGNARLGMPTCWDQWFPELARAYSIGGAELLVYPTAIGSEPDHPDFDTQPLWQSVIVGNGIANGLFMVVPNRFGNEGTITFYGSSFVSDPYGRILAQAPRDEAAVLVVDVELAQRDDWLTLFPFLETRRPDAYGILTERIR